MNVLITGGCGFIGSNLVHFLRRERPDWRLVVLDKLTYAANPENLRALEGDDHHRLVRGDVADAAAVADVLAAERIDAVVHLAAETHVDRSIADEQPFLRTNVVGTGVLLDAARAAGVRRVLVASTDEVYGEARAGERFAEGARLAPSSPYAASKAAADLLALSVHRTYGLDLVVARSSNNYGRFQFPEKLIPLMVTRALNDEPLPVYGDGRQQRDWLHVDDQCEALLAALERGRAGEVYNFGAGVERTNLHVVKTILELLGRPPGLVRHVADRPGHDRRYALDTAKARTELRWQPKRHFESGLEATVRWYVDHRAWWERVLSGEYRSWFEAQYGQRLRG